MIRQYQDLLWQSSLRFLLKHPWHFLLSILGVALGVAMVISIDLSNSSAQRAFSLSAEALTGKTTHQIEGSGDFLSDQVYRDLRLTTGYRNSAPVIDGYGTLQGLDRTFQILGVDPIAEGPFRDFSSQDGGIDLAMFITGQPTAVISESVLADLAKNIGDSIQVSVSGRLFDLLVVGAIATDDKRSQQALESLLLIDINTAQQLFGMASQLSRIDLIIPNENEESIIASLSSGLPVGTRLVSTSSHTDILSQMTRAFELNLQALSLLALLVGMFLIYNTMTFSVVQRLPLIGRLRALGVTKSEILSMILKEAVLIGLIGTILGITAGIGLAQFLLGLVTQSINDLYFVLSVQELTIEMALILKAIILGLGATLLAAFWPAREASEAEVSTVLRRSSSESRLVHRLPITATIGLAIGLAGGCILLLPNDGIIAGYSILLFVIIGFSLLIPSLMVGLAAFMRPIFGTLNGLIGKMSVRGVVTELSRTSVAVAALVVAVAASVGVGIMVDSFRVTVISWLESQLQADIYVQPPSAVARKADAQLQTELVHLLKETEGVESVHSVFSEDVMTTFGSSNLVTTSLGVKASESYQTKEIQDGFWGQFAQEKVIMISEAYAYRFGIGIGDSLGIMTDKGMQYFPIKAIYFDYASDMGTVTMNRSLYDRFFGNRAISGLALYADDQTEVNVLVDRLRDRAAGVQDVFIRSNKGLREASIEIFDRTFTVTVVLRLLAVMVAFVGILSSLMALQLERAREHAVLRANGMTPGQLWNYVITQTGVMGVIAGVLSIPLGLLISYVLVYVINLRSFGWTLEFMVNPSLLIQAVGLAVGAALLAGIYPSWKMASANPAEALRSE